MTSVEASDCGNCSDTCGNFSTTSTNLRTTFVQREYTNFVDRMNTFHNWPRAHPITKMELCHAGFIYTGQSDKVKCYNCGVYIFNFESSDKPWMEHQKFSPNCQLVRMLLPSSLCDTETLCERPQC